VLRHNRPKGTQDFIPPVSEQKLLVENTFRRLARLYGYQEIVTPTFEHTEVFIKSSGSASDIVTKEMYTFQDRSERSLTLKPEGTPGVVRAVLENRLLLPCRLYYITPCFRYSRPQKGRYREFYQLGVEALGEGSPLTDAEVVRFGIHFFSTLGITDCLVRVNSIGCRTCRPVYREKLLAFLRLNQEQLCPDCQERIELNPLRVFDCKNSHCHEILGQAPLARNHLCAQCQDHFHHFTSELSARGIRFEIDDHLVRGLDYYNRTTFEFISGALGAQNSIGGGGRYDYLIEEFGGPPTPAIGLAIGLERTLLAMPAAAEKPGRRPLVFVIWTTPAELAPARDLTEKLRAADIPCQIAFENPKLKRQFHLADTAAARLALVVGAEELRRGVYGVKDLLTGQQTEVPAAELIDYLKQQLSR
jgi:histidyl-tRNA synthetase